MCCALSLSRDSSLQPHGVEVALQSSPPGSSVHGILQAKILEWVAMPSSRGSSQPGDLPNPGIEPASLALAGLFFTTSASREALMGCVYL